MLPYLEAVSSRYRRHDQRQFHFRHILAHTASRPVAEGYNTRHLLLRKRSPTLWVEIVGVRTPKGDAMMNGVGGNREYGTCWEVMIAYRDAGAWRYDAWKAERGG